MMHNGDPSEASSDNDLDYSSPAAQDSLRDITAFITEVRSNLYRRTALYERTLGLAVIPVLIRRALIRLRRRIKRRGQVNR
jgi:hypothetical protein